MRIDRKLLEEVIELLEGIKANFDQEGEIYNYHIDEVENILNKLEPLKTKKMKNPKIVNEYVDTVKDDKTEFLKEMEAFIRATSEKYFKEGERPLKGVILAVVDNEPGKEGEGQCMVSMCGSGATISNAVEHILENEPLKPIVRMAIERMVLVRLAFKPDPSKD